jgi:hypothetical protein
MNSDLKDTIQLWCEDNGFAELSYRIALVPDDILEKILFEMPLNAEKILEENGY